MAGLDVKLIPEFDGSGEDHVVDWIEKVEMVCTLQTPAAPQECVIPLRLRGGALSVYRQLSSEDKKDAEKSGGSGQASPWTLDIFLAELEQLASLFGGMTEEGISCAFVTGLPDSVRRWHRRELHAVTVSGEHLKCVGIADVRVAVPGLRRVTVSALVVRDKPLGFSMIAGMDAVRELGGVLVRSPGDVHFGCEPAGEACAASPVKEGSLRVDREDFCVTFDPVRREWTVSWEWSAGNPPPDLAGHVDEYPVPAEARAEYEAELGDWVKNGWLREYDESEMGPPKGLIPLMAVVQKTKVRPVMDFRPLNRHLTTHTADADVCAEQTRRWRRMGTDVALLDLKKAYLQIHVDKKLWPYQTVIYRGKRHCLTRLGFGMNLSPSVMKAVLETVLSQDAKVEAAVSSYVDDILVNEAVLPARDVAEHLRNFGLESKEPADTLTRVPEKWMKGRTANGDAAAVADSGGAAVSDTAAAGGTASSDSDGDAVNAALGTAGPAPARGDGDGETTTSGNGRQEDDDALLNEAIPSLCVSLGDKNPFPVRSCALWERND
ncbi:uncharacterized protein LOC122388023 [Amphibalanus amphitrite]|uniref:uncharacterized protein LOC122388023 n=1 Tax=Amphibalanus amphitrite TaxID=1232801 RepID=UPI001C9138BD|nr:uncharacterized protein LOC122388023 [Amphibalanus amphitrite]